MHVRLKEINKVSKRLASGKRTTYYYAWRGGPRLLSEPYSPEFIAEYSEAHRLRGAPEAGTLATLIYDYQTSREFEKLAKLTKRDHLAMFKLIEEEFGDMPIGALDDRACRADFKKWRDSFASDRQADRAWASLKRVFSVAKDNCVLTWNPCEGGGKRYNQTRAEFIWSEQEFQTFCQTAPRHVSLPLIFAYYTGQRQGDILRLQWSAYDGQRIRLKQRKTGRRVSVLVNPAFRLVIESLKRSSTHMLVNSRGRPWTSQGFQASFRKAKTKAEIVGRTFHDMRGTFVTNRRRENSDLNDIADIVGLSTRDVERVLKRHYLAHDETRSDAVILRMKDAKQ